MLYPLHLVYSLFPLLISSLMIGVFDSVIFYIAPPTARRIGDNSEKMASMLRTGNAVYKSIIDDDVTHVICDSSDFGVTRKLVSDSVFCSFVTPKWVFISNSLHYSLPVVSTGFVSLSCVEELFV